MKARSLVFKPMRWMLAPVFHIEEALLVRKSRQMTWPATFIIGAPRSGTTLMSQLIVGSFHTSYICNFAETCPTHPAAATLLVRKAIRRYQPKFTSNYGYSNGRPSPNEGRAVWRRWFGLGWMDESMITPQLRQEAYGTIAAIERLVGAPFVSKDTRHGLRMSALSATFPGCLFIWIRRDPVRVAESLLGARRVDRREPVDGPTEQQWWGVRPRGFEVIKDHDYIDQICEQIYYTERDILDGIQAVGPERCIQVSYEDLCKDPGGEVARIERFLSQRGVKMEAKGAHIPPLEMSHRRQASDMELDAIRRACEALYEGQAGQPALGPARASR